MRFSRPGIGTILGAIALFIALGGSSYAAIASLPPHSVGTRQLKNRAVTTAKIANGAVTHTKLAKGAVGPAAEELVYNARGSASGTPTGIGKIGPWSAKGSCTQTGSTTTLFVDFAGPDAQDDSFVESEGVADVGSEPFLPHDGPFETASSSSSMTPTTAYSQQLLIPTSGTPIQLMNTVSITGGVLSTCHASFAITPTKAAGSSSAAHAPAERKVQTRTPSARGRFGGVTIAGVSVPRR